MEENTILARIRLQKELRNSLYQIRSLFIYLAKERLINPGELESYNKWASQSHYALQELNHLLWLDRREIEGKRIINQSLSEKAQKYHLILLMRGLNPGMIDRLTDLPKRFLVIVLDSLYKYGNPVPSNLHFELILQKYRWVNHQIERDIKNIGAVRIQKKLYYSKNRQVSEIALRILKQIAEESIHIVTEIRDGKTEADLYNLIQNYWYEKLSTFDPCN